MSPSLLSIVQSISYEGPAAPGRSGRGIPERAPPHAISTAAGRALFATGGRSIRPGGTDAAPDFNLLFSVAPSNSDPSIRSGKLPARQSCRFTAAGRKTGAFVGPLMTAGPWPAK